MKYIEETRTIYLVDNNEKKKIKYRRSIESSEDTKHYNYLINFLFPGNREAKLTHLQFRISVEFVFKILKIEITRNFVVIILRMKYIEV